jgi:predicted MFS family arabinose efflux permease
VRIPLIALLCLAGLGNTCSLGAFPALLPELGVDARLRDWELGVVAAAFGFARMVADVPIGLFIVRRLPAALVAGPLVMAAGALLLASADTFPTLVAGRVVMGVGHAINTVAGLTALLQYCAGRRLGAALNAFEFSAMIGLLTGASLAAVLPRGLPWSTVLLLACAPQVIGVVLLPAILGALRPDAMEASAPSGSASAEKTAPGSGLLVGLAFVAGALIAVTYTSVEQFIIPLRGSREFGLERPGLARLLMVILTADLVALLPLGVLSDRLGPGRILGGVALTVAAGAVLVGFGGIGTMAFGCALFGFGMAGWMIPLSVLRRQTPRALVAWRTALYRVGVDAGMFLGPFLSGLAGVGHLGTVAVTLGGVLAVVGAVLLLIARNHRT